MDKPISVGDLVAVVKSCCDRYSDGISIFYVARINGYKPFRCAYCGTTLPVEGRGLLNLTGGGFPISWLRRIPPPDELGITDDSEKEHA